MTVCPIAVVATCKKCPAFALCPLKTILGDLPRKANTGEAPTKDKKKSQK